MISAKRLPDLLGGTLKNAGTFCYGTSYGYNTVLRLAPGHRNGVYGFTLGVKNDSDSGNSGLLAWLLSFRDENKKLVKEVSVTAFSCFVAIAASNEKKLIERAGELMPKVYGYLSENGYFTCCTSCGKSDGEISCYSVNSVPSYLCADCVAEIDASLSEEKSKRSVQNSNLLPGIVGALGGTLIGVGVYLLIARLGYLSAIGGLVMAVLAVKGYEKLGGCLDKKGVVVCMVMVIAGACLGNRLDWSIDAAQALKEYDWTFFDCFRNLDYILTQLEIKSNYVTSLLMALLFTVLGAVGTLFSALRHAKGEYRIVKHD